MPAITIPVSTESVAIFSRHWFPRHAKWQTPLAFLASSTLCNNFRSQVPALLKVNMHISNNNARNSSLRYSLMRVIYLWLRSYSRVVNLPFTITDDITGAAYTRSFSSWGNMIISFNQTCAFRGSSTMLQTHLSSIIQDEFTAGLTLVPNLNSFSAKIGVLISLNSSC